MKSPIRILLQTTIPVAEDDWHVGRFSLLRQRLSSLRDHEGRPLCKVTARDDQDSKTISWPNYHSGSSVLNLDNDAIMLIVAR